MLKRKRKIIRRRRKKRIKRRKKERRKKQSEFKLLILYGSLFTILSKAAVLYLFLLSLCVAWK